MTEKEFFDRLKRIGPEYERLISRTLPVKNWCQGEVYLSGELPQGRLPERRLAQMADHTQATVGQGCRLQEGAAALQPEGAVQFHRIHSEPRIRHHILQCRLCRHTQRGGHHRHPSESDGQDETLCLGEILCCRRWQERQGSSCCIG